MADSDQNSQIVNNPDSPNEPLPPGDGDGGGNGHPPPVRITSISPIAGNLAGGIDVTITGFGFQQGAEVFFGTTASANLQVQSSTQVIATAPAGTQTGTVPISIQRRQNSRNRNSNSRSLTMRRLRNICEFFIKPARSLLAAAVQMRRSRDSTAPSTTLSKQAERVWLLSKALIFGTTPLRQSRL